jgi:class 3 adenylate cyclase
MSASDTPAIVPQLVPAGESCPLPDDPVLAEAAIALRDSGYWAEIVDAAWRLVYVTDDLRLGSGGMVEQVAVPLGVHHFGPELLAARERSRTGATAVGALREVLTQLGNAVLAETPGGREELRRLVDPRLRDVVDALDPVGLAASTSGSFTGYGPGGNRPKMLWTAMRVRDLDGRLAGTVILTKPESRMSVLATVTALGDGRHFDRMQGVAKAGRRPAAILFADLTSSSQLARKLSTPSYFSLVRRIVRAADQCVIERGGLVGRHAGDGVVAFFLAETAGSESECARRCIQAARDLDAKLAEVGARSNLSPDELMMRIGLHWGATLYVGQIASGGRTEVTALGDEVNECARIEACASPGRILASKNLLERVEPEDAQMLGLDTGRLTYTPLARLPGASEKARRDAPAVPVCEI